MLNLMSFSPSNFTRYVSQTEQSLNETNGINEWSTKTPPASIVNETLSFPSVVASPSTPAPTSVLPVNNSQKIILPPTIIKDDVEPLPFPQHAPGPIQRPNKLTNQSTTTTSTYLSNTIQSPGTPEVLYQINRFLDQQNNSTTTTPSSAAAVATTATTTKTGTNVNNSSVPITDLSTPSIPWTPFTQTEWPPKYDSSWPMTASVGNPFALIAPINEQQRVPTNEETTVWSTALGTATPRLVTSTRTQRASAWNDIFQSTVPSSTDLTKPTTNSWLWIAPDPSTTDIVGPSNGHETNTNHAIWNLNTLSNESVIPSTISTTQQQVPSTGWWSNSTSDENNNTNQTNHLNDDSSTNRDQSRWDFAR